MAMRERYEQVRFIEEQNHKASQEYLQRITDTGTCEGTFSSIERKTSKNGLKHNAQDTNPLPPTPLTSPSPFLTETKPFLGDGGLVCIFFGSSVKNANRLDHPERLVAQR
jgi:hypothetical protein